MLFPRRPAVTGGGGGELTGFAISGAGTSAINGTYCPDGDGPDGKTQYAQTGGGAYLIQYRSDYFGAGPAWIIRSSGSSSAIVLVYSGADEPPLTGWESGPSGSWGSGEITAASCS